MPIHRPFACAIPCAILCLVGWLFCATAFAARPDDQPPKRAQAATDVMTAEMLFGDNSTIAFCYGGFRHATRKTAPTIKQLKEDLRILAAMNVSLIRTYNTQQFAQAKDLLTAIEQLKQEDPQFVMYVMLGAWIECQGAWGDAIDHSVENLANNQAEIDAAVQMANEHPDIVKSIAVGNESMVHWATQYYVTPVIVKKWVDHLQSLKRSGDLPASLWITSSDNYESWGGGGAEYRTKELEALVRAVDFVSLHTYPFHETHYLPDTWVVPQDQQSLSIEAKSRLAVDRALDRAKEQFANTRDYVRQISPKKPLHIGETGWASVDGTVYGPKGSRAADEFKAALFYQGMRKWTNSKNIRCFYFEAFDEQWKDARDPQGSENHFGLIRLDGQAKFALWDVVSEGRFDGLTRDGQDITKSYEGSLTALMADVMAPPTSEEMGGRALRQTNPSREIGQQVTESIYVVSDRSINPDEDPNATFPSAPLKLNPWEGTCEISMSASEEIEVTTYGDEWWGCGLEIQASGQGENLSRFQAGKLCFEIKGNVKSPFEVGFQTGVFSADTQTNHFVKFGPGLMFELTDQWQAYQLPIGEMNKNANMADVTGVFCLRSAAKPDATGQHLYVRNIYYSLPAVTEKPAN